MPNKSAALLVLQDGTTFEGTSFGAEGERTGEVVFNTSLTGYQEILTDPSYNGQIVTMTYPLSSRPMPCIRPIRLKPRPWVIGKTFVIHHW